MQVTNTEFEGLLIMEPKVFFDDRGYFMESYNLETHKAQTLNYTFMQDNEAKSCYGVVRGFHFQTGQFAQTKLIRAVYGEILDVVVDLRQNSKTFKKWFSIHLNDQNKKQLLVPKGFAHAYAVLSPMAIVQYKCDAFYNKDHESGISIFDETLNIDWQIPRAQILHTTKDIQWPNLNELKDELF